MIKIGAVIIREQGQYVLQCLEYDIGSQGNTIKECVDRLFKTVKIELENRNNTLVDIPMPPNQYMKMYADAEFMLYPLIRIFNGISYEFNCVIVEKEDLTILGTKNNDNPDDYTITRHPIFISDSSLIVISVFKSKSGMDYGHLFLSDYVDYRKQTSIAAGDIIRQIADLCSINMLWSLKEAINEEIDRRNKRSLDYDKNGKIWTYDRPIGDE